MKEYFTMSSKEADRVEVLTKLINKEIKGDKAAKLLCLSLRQVWRLKKKYQLSGPKGLCHGLRSRKSNRRIDPETIDKALEVVKKNYWDFGPTLAWEKLKKYHNVKFSVETLRKAMVKAGLWQPVKRKTLKVYQQRPRRSSEGELIQIDGSPHAWFEDRGPTCCLLGFIDDATSKAKHLEFAPSETTIAYLKTSKNYLRKHGKPLALYTDKHSIFRINMAKRGTSSTYDSQGQTQFARVLKELGIKLISANSPQAKGRVERLFKTLQDRLVKELRLNNINSIKKANSWLPEFIKDFNSRFAVRPRSRLDLHRPLPADENLENIFVLKYKRILSKNLTCQFENKSYQVKTKRPAYAMRHAPILVIKDLEGRITLNYKGKKLNYKIFKKQPKARIASSKTLNKTLDKIKTKKTKSLWRPAADHPWRGGFSYA
jgi:hypothetical protein